MTAPDDDARDRLLAQVETVRAGEALGRSQTLDRLLQFLLDCSLDGRTPKELEVADQVFGRSGGGVDRDSSVRVHIHRLRRKLDDFYAGAGAGEAERLVMPKGSYRLMLQPMASADQVELPRPPLPVLEPVAATGRQRGRTIVSATIGVLLLLVLAASGGWWLARRPDSGLRTVRASAAWAPAIVSGTRIQLVLGDYYIFGERDEDGDIEKLVRRFDINSAQDLDEWRAAHPDRAGVDVDLGLNYLPVGIGNALRAVVPVVRSDGYAPIGNLVVPASQMSAEQLKLVNIVYLGYLSGLGTLRDPVFSGSRFAIGGSYDEVVDRRTGRSYMAGTHLGRKRSNAQPRLCNHLVLSRSHRQLDHRHRGHARRRADAGGGLCDAAGRTGGGDPRDQAGHRVRGAGLGREPAQRRAARGAGHAGAAARGRLVGQADPALPRRVSRDAGPLSGQTKLRDRNQ